MIINNAFVMSCNAVELQLLCAALKVSDNQRATASDKKLRAIVDTKLANSATFSDAFNASTLDHTVLMHAPLNAYFEQSTASAEQSTQQAHAPHGKRAMTKSAKQWLIDLLSALDADGKPVEYTLAELITLTGKTEVNIRTMLSDLRSAKYAGKYGVFNTASKRVNNVTYYYKQ